MGFAAGLQAGSALVSKALENERLKAAEGRAQSEYDYKVKEREGVDKAVADVQAPWQDAGLNTTSPVAKPAALPNAPPTSVAATAATGVPPTPPAGLPTPATGGLPAPAAAGLPAPAAAPAEGLPAPAAPAAEGLPAPAAAAPAAQPVRELTGEKKLAQSLFNVAKAKKDVAGMNAAVEQYHVAARKELVNDAAKMSDDDAYQYLHENINKVGSLPMSVVKEGKNGYRVTAWSDDGGKGASALLSSSEVKKLVAADKMMKVGYGSEGLDLAGSVDKSLNAVIKDYNTETNQQVTTGNTATHYGNTEAETARHNRAGEANAAAGLQLRRNAADREKYQNADTWQDKDGNTYKSVMEVGKNGPQMKAFKIGGEDGSLQPINALPKGLTKVGAGGGRAGPDKEIPAEGTKLKRADGSTYQSDGMGGEISVKAPLPSERPAKLMKSGFSKEEAASLPWSDDGEHIKFNGQGYNVNDKEDMKALRALIDETNYQGQKSKEDTAYINSATARAEAENAARARIRQPQQALPMFPTDNRPNW